LPPSPLPVGAPVSTAARKTSSTTSWLASTSAGSVAQGLVELLGAMVKAHQQGTLQMRLEHYSKPNC